MKTVFLSILVTLLFSPLTLWGSDHDDGEMELKGRSLNLTDLYVFRDDWQRGPSGDKSSLVFIMNTNPRSLARQQYYFSTKAHYDFHVSQVLKDNKAKRPTGSDDVILRFEFDSPDSSGRQAIHLELIKNGKKIAGSKAGVTTPLADAAAGRANLSNVKIKNQIVQVFAGLREDSFFFDVERYFRIRALLATGVNTLGDGPIQGGPNVFRSDDTAVDFTVGYNVNSIVVKVPIALLQSDSLHTVFDVWETISLQRRRFPFVQKEYRQIERLGRPAINEGLVISNGLLNQYNSIPPSQDLTGKAKPVLEEAGLVLTKVFDYATGAGLLPPKPASVVVGFIPDVLRIDSEKSIPVGTWAYNGDFVVTSDGGVSGALLTGGRKLEDDVIDITLSYLLAGAPACGPGSPCAVRDGISYDGGTRCSDAGKGRNFGNPGHRCLNGQTIRNGEAVFPYLALPH